MNVQELKYRLILERCTVDNVESVGDENTNITEFHVPYEIMFLR